MDTSEDSGEDASIPSEEEVAYLRSDIESNERLLLSSARQNPLNVNTLILPPYPLPTTTPSHNRYSRARTSSRPLPWLASVSGIPLRRQNAIRGGVGRHHYRRYNPQTETSSTQPEIAEGEDKYLKELSALGEDNNSRLKKLLSLEAEELHKDIVEVYKAIKSISTFQGESPLFFKNNYEYSKKFRILFFAKLNRAKFQSDQPGLPNLEFAMDSYLKKRRNKSLFLNVKPTIAPPPKSKLFKKPLKKKRRIHRYQDTSVKRQKIAAGSKPQETHLLFNSKLSLSKSEKETILSCLPSSYMQSGSSFAISMTSQPTPLQQGNLVFTNVTGPELNGVFNFESSKQPGMTDLHCMLLKLHSFIKYFCGFTDNSLPRNKILVRKLNVLDRISVDPKIKYVSQLKYPEVNVPFSGHLIDFNKYDLRFMESGRFGARERSNRVRLQLGEWMKMSPFIQFKENYFISFLHELEDNLKHFRTIRAKKEQKSEALHLTKQFKANLFQLTKDFGFINSRNNSSIPFLDEQSSRKQGKYRDGFLEDWDRSLAHRLCEVITSNDSSTLLNVQLNYVLFVIKVDLSKLLDEYILFIFDHVDVSSEDRVEYINKYKNVYNSIFRDEHQRQMKERDTTPPPVATLLGSIDRKMGQIEVHNTVPNMYYREPGAKYMTNIIMTRHSPVTLTDYGSRNTYVYDDFEVFNSEESTLPVPANSRSFNTRSGYVENDDSIETKLVGSSKFVNKGNPVCGMV
ncbi:uncharacterized protein SPAPADRAFT_135095 [Spathaspora passalidarum NRRL Y-27907]|uniref:Uncharacterized protein n=1 Tax=Spathaspora passalidarum (strain NRRL Y-27907 / 11-Y1) TaxID=619300 RepID=G3AIT3_SPAPN|nr:uncharacterized protein SPAPADRAFT_135095 [Spathaspora passalidarum NRRL Y-27907]EGW34499.1 hypothetical protein SPAPADRAFT_135095 [Spathaspora passalidarum NRRL Y-27907]